ncbi:hypothetical protein AX16_008142 [Volvariella volvacea WC 439]|nr:hypothetical protein AX16_008142 [Volvariella volvacea WC 439]
MHDDHPGNIAQATLNGKIDDETRWKHPIQAECRLKIICIGAGASGLIFAYKLQRSFSNFDLIVYEKNPGVTGTWFENKYPGCACDVASHAYTYSFEPNPNYSSVFAGTDEIEAYFKSFAAKYDLNKFCKTQHQVVGAFWNEKKGYWRVDVRNLETGESLTDECHVLVNASGILNAWKWPKIPGLEKFKGPRMHTAQWDKDVDLRGKHVAVIGNGSSAVQLVPAIYPIVSKITTFFRSPTWVSRPVDLEFREFTEEERKTFATNPAAFLEYRKRLEIRYHGLFLVLNRDSKEQEAARTLITNQMKSALAGNRALQERLIPDWALGCRRVTPSAGYLQTLGKDNVEVVWGEVERITETGCIAGGNGDQHEFDILICATGFDTSFVPRFPVIGRDGRSLNQEWADEPKAYLGIAAAEFPNYFTFMGPNCPVGIGPLPRVSEVQADYMLKFINRLQTENIHSFAPKRQAIEDLTVYKDRSMAKMVWSDGCPSWYKGNNTNGKVIAMWSGSLLHYIEALSDVRYDHWDIRYSGNMFAYLGNGFSQAETDPTADMAYYIGTEDSGSYLSTRKAREMTNRKVAEPLHRMKTRL